MVILKKNGTNDIETRDDAKVDIVKNANTSDKIESTSTTDKIESAKTELHNHVEKDKFSYEDGIEDVENESEIESEAESENFLDENESDDEDNSNESNNETDDYFGHYYDDYSRPDHLDSNGDNDGAIDQEVDIDIENMTTEAVENISSIPSINHYVPEKDVSSYSNAQQGEDVVLKCVLMILFNTRTNIRYLDIGCNHPYIASNTYLFYKELGSGVLVDANPTFKEAMERLRPRDVFVCAGVVPKLGAEKELKFYYFVHADGLSTFSLEKAKEVRNRFKPAEGSKTKNKERELHVITVPIIQINDLLEQHFSGQKIDILSVDVEGFDEELLRVMDYEKYRPKVIIMESNKIELKYSLSEFVDFMETKDYILVADTFINYIFADRTQIQIQPKKWYTEYVTYNGSRIPESDDKLKPPPSS